MVRTLDRSWVSAGRHPVFLIESMNLAEVPKMVMPSSRAKSNNAVSLGYAGEPS